MLPNPTAKIDASQLAAASPKARSRALAHRGRRGAAAARAVGGSSTSADKWDQMFRIFENLCYGEMALALIMRESGDHAPAPTDRSYLLWWHPLKLKSNTRKQPPILLLKVSKYKPQ